jgi:hypothetical protein
MVTPIQVTDFLNSTKSPVINYVNKKVDENIMNLARNFFSGVEFSPIPNSEDVTANVFWSGLGTYSLRSCLNEINR